MIPGMLVARARDHHTAAMQLRMIERRLKAQSHLRPGRKWNGAAELYPAFVEYYRVGREGKARLPRFNRDVM